jgi:outer membrane protein TolC
MKTSIKIITIFFLFSGICLGQITDSVIVPESPVLDLNSLIDEAIQNNPEIRAAQADWDMFEAKIPQAKTLDDPQLNMMQEEIPGFKFGNAMYFRAELMQMFPYPGKLSSMEELARIKAQHSHHDHLEKINAIIGKLKEMYFELWYVQQASVLNRENFRLMKQFLNAISTKLRTGATSQQDVLKASIELSKADIELLSLRQKELSVKAMLMSMLNRSSKDTIGYATIAEEIAVLPSLDSIQQLAMRLRPMLKHDSVGVHESTTMIALAKKEYYPDFTVGLRYDTSPEKNFNGWTISAGITLPFAPWTIAKADSRLQEAEIALEKSQANLNATRNMVIANINDLYFKALANKQQLESFQTSILPQTRQSLEASLTAYQSGRTDFLMLLDSYRMLVDMTSEYYMKRMEFEQTLAQLDKEVGFQNVAATKK